jgi:hypothetical protein
MSRPPDAQSSIGSEPKNLLVSRREFTSAGLLTGLVIAIELADSGTSWALVGENGSALDPAVPKKPLLMLFGRLGPIVVATSLALRKTKRHFELPKERPLIG